jgi:hypothetical protein
MTVLLDKTNDLFVGTQDLCVQSNKTGPNKTGLNKPISIRMDILDWTGRKDLASLQTILSGIKTNDCIVGRNESLYCWTKQMIVLLEWTNDCIVGRNK